MRVFSCRTKLDSDAAHRAETEKLEEQLRSAIDIKVGAHPTPLPSHLVIPVIPSHPSHPYPSLVILVIPSHPYPSLVIPVISSHP